MDYKIVYYSVKVIEKNC